MVVIALPVPSLQGQPWRSSCLGDLPLWIYMLCVLCKCALERSFVALQETFTVTSRQCNGGGKSRVETRRKCRQPSYAGTPKKRGKSRACRLTKVTRCSPVEVVFSVSTAWHWHSYLVNPCIPRARSLCLQRKQ